MTSHSKAITAVGVLTVFVFVAATPSNSMPVDQYLKLRREMKFDHKLTWTDVSPNPGQFADKVMEISGVINGVLRREKGTSFMLSLPDKQAVLLDAPESDLPLVSAINSARVRVLVQVLEKPLNNLAPLKTLAIAREAEVSLKEQEASARADAAQAELDEEKRIRREESTKRANKPFSSRSQSAFSNPAMMGSVSAMAQKYLSSEALRIYPAYRGYILRCNKKLSEHELDQITVSLLYFSQKYRVDPRLVVSMIIAESDFNPRDTSHKGAMGLGQIMPDEAKTLGLKNPYDPIENVGAAVLLLKQKLQMYSQGAPDGKLTQRQVELALAAYNAGPGAVKKYGGVPPYRETQGYIKRILKVYAELCSN